MKFSIKILLFLFLIFSSSKFVFAQDSEKIKSLKEKLNTAKHDSERIVALGDLSWELQNFDMAAAEKYVTEELKIAEKLNLPKFLAFAYNDVGLVKLKKGNLTESLELNKKALAIRRKLNDEMGVGSSLNKIGNIYTRLENYDKSLDAYLECLKIYEKFKIKPYIAYSQNNIAQIYFQIHKSDMAIGYYRSAIATNTELSDFINLAGNYGNLGNVYLDQKQYDSALIALHKSVQLFKQTKVNYGLPNTYNSIAYAYKALGNLQEAKKYYFEAMQLCEAIKDTAILINCYNNCADILLKLKQPDASKVLIDKAYTMAITTNQTNNLRQSYSKYFNYYMQKGNTDLAEMYFEKLNKIKDSLLNSDMTKQIAEMSVKYESGKKQEENLLLKKDNKIKALTLWFLVIGLLLSVITFYLIFNRNKLKQKSILQAEMLKQQELRSKAVLEAEETERQRIAKDLHDGIGQMLSAVKLNLSSVQHRITIDEKEKLLFQNAISLVDDSVKEVRTISHNMMPNMLIKKGLANAVRDFIDKLSGTTLKIDLEITGMNERIETSMESIIFRVLQELVNNIIKHANADHITLQLLRFENELTIMIEDNGVGFNVKETLLSDKGIGLKNIISRIEFLKGNINYDSTIGKGTTVTIDIPLA
ncbi:MAG: hypothetical protein RJA07_1005 [Bacteroidota bacterium]|jgi:signal transduction histidine kinase